MESHIHGRYTQARIFKNPLTKYAPACDISRNSPSFLSKHQYTIVINIKIGKSSPNIEQKRKKELNIPPVSSLINCKNNNGSIKIFIISVYIYLDIYIFRMIEYIKFTIISVKKKYKKLPNINKKRKLSDTSTLLLDL